MNWDAYEDIDVAIREMDDEDDDEREAPRKTKFRLERAVCPRCRMLLSVVETRKGRCSTCHAVLEPRSTERPSRRLAC
jgi:hypothetical protein